MNPLLLCLALCAADPVGPGTFTRNLVVDERPRSYLVHVPKNYQPDKPTPVVLVFHGAGMNAPVMVPFSGMNEKSEEAGFIAVYPNGTGYGIFLGFNSGGLAGKLAETARQPDDVKFVTALLDDLATVVNIDSKRIYACGMSNGGMMCYRLAAELSDRIAAVAPVAGTIAIEDAKPKRPVPILHFHGTADPIVPFGGPDARTPKFLNFKSVEETVQVWAKINSCQQPPSIEKLDDRVDDGTIVTRKTYSPAQDGVEIVLVEIAGGGHTWPGRRLPVYSVGKSTQDISANDLIWEFFQRHPLP